LIKYIQKFTFCKLKHPNNVNIAALHMHLIKYEITIWHCREELLQSSLVRAGILSKYLSIIICEPIAIYVRYTSMKYKDNIHRKYKIGKKLLVNGSQFTKFFSPMSISRENNYKNLLADLSRISMSIT